MDLVLGAYSIGMGEGEHTQTARGVVIAALVIAALAVAGVGAYLLYPRQPESRYADVTVNTVLKQENHDFITGLSYLKVKDFDKALSSFEAAFTHASDAWQEGLISYYIGFAKEQLGRYTDAIEAYKTIATNTDYYPIIRAYAAQQIGVMYHLYWDAKPVIAVATFTGDPFASFKQEGDYEEHEGYDASYMRLFEYAASIYPLALSESYVASLYALDLRLRLKGATTTAEGRVAVQRAEAALQATDADLARLARNPDEAVFISGVYVREALAKGYLILSGVPGYTNEEVNSLYLKALDAAASTGQPPGNFIAWLYGNFLERTYGKLRIADIEKVLAPFSVNNTENISPLIPPYFKSLATNPAYGHHKSAVVRAAALVPTFKAYLVSLGWHASDFAGT